MDRKQQMIKLREQRYSYKVIGYLFGISRQMAQRIITGVRYGVQGRDRTREKVRERDDYTCQKCGKRWKKGERKLDVHHIDCDNTKSRKYEPRLEIINMIALCHKCHLNLPEHRKSMSIKMKESWNERRK